MRSGNHRRGEEGNKRESDLTYIKISLSCAFSGPKCCLDFAEKDKRLQHLYEKCKSCTERKKPFEGQTFFIEKPKVKAKGDKMMISERYFEGCGRDLSGCPS